MQENNHIIEQGQNYLVLIAINRFKHLQPLFYSVQDAQRLSQVLSNSYGFPESNIVRLFNERASHVAIWKTLEEVNRSLSDQDNLLIYYAGYSYQKRSTQDSYLLGYDSDPAAPYGLIYQEPLIERINMLRARNVFFVVNSGFSTELIQSNPAVIQAEWEEIEGSRLPQVRTEEFTRWGMASMPLEENRDNLIGDSPVFVRSMIQYLESNSDQPLSAKTLFQHLQHLQTYEVSHPIGGYLGELPIGGGAFTFTPHEGPIKQVKGKTASPPPSNDQASSPKGEEEELREAVRINEVPVYLDFIFNYPDSPHINFVQERIRTLQKGARPESKNPLSFIADNALWISGIVLVLVTIFLGVSLLGGLPSVGGSSVSIDQVELVVEAPLEEVLTRLENQMIPLEGGIFRTSSEGVRGISNFEISAKEVSQNEWKVIMGALPENVNSCPTCPIDNISWQEVQRFIQKLNEFTGKTYRLPTSSEWEFAATGGKELANQVLLSGIDGSAWHAENSDGALQPVGKKERNAVGMYDMYGNVWEWCFDRVIAGSSIQSPIPCGDPRGQNRMIRGGGWDTPPEVYSVGISENLAENQKRPGLGFRLARGGVPPCDEEMKDAFHYPAIEMVEISGGQFEMGPDEVGNRVSVQLPSFEMAKFELSQELWEAIMGENPSWNIICSTCPVESVSWEQVQEFIAILNAKRNATYRLPTEAEWEYAARGGPQQSNSQFAGVGTLDDLHLYGNCFFGDGVLSVGDYPIDKYPSIAPVGSLLPNELGIHDLSGNVWELCQDWKGPYPTTPLNSPEGPPSGTEKVIRGGGWNGNPEDCMLSVRRGMGIQEEGSRWIGFRLVRDLP